MSGGNLRIALLGAVLIVLGIVAFFVDPFTFWRVNLVVFELTFVIAGSAIVVIGLWKTNERFTPKRRLQCLEAVVVAMVVVFASYYAVLYERHKEPLREHDGDVTYEIRNLPHTYYTSWGRAWLYVYSGEPVPVEDPHLIVYPISGSWSMNSSVLMGEQPVEHDFGSRNLGGAWFNLTVSDIKGDGQIGDGDRLRLQSHNGSFAVDTEYFVRFGVGGPIAPVYVVYGFEFSNGDFNSWLQYGPVEYGM